jgi:hypothetical protein
MWKRRQRRSYRESKQRERDREISLRIKAGIFVVAALIAGGWYSVVLGAAVLAGGIIALFLTYSRHGEL